ncbi:MAG: translation initiation factor IF-2 subunit beta [Methanocellales archaeon]
MKVKGSVSTLDEYESILNRAMKKAPPVKVSDTRFIIPPPRVFSEGRTTVLDNFKDIVSVLNRDPDHVMKFLVREMGTAGKIDGSRAIFQGKFTADAIWMQINRYVEEFVTCQECGRPDTHLIKQDRILMLKCDACGAWRPVQRRVLKKPVVAPQTVEEGKEYELQISAVGKKGDGIAIVSGITIFVPGAQKGETVRVVVKKLSGNLAFADRVDSGKRSK